MHVAFYLYFMYEPLSFRYSDTFGTHIQHLLEHAYIFGLVTHYDRRLITSKSLLHNDSVLTDPEIAVII